MSSTDLNSRPGDLASWENYLNGINPNIIELGLDRIRKVAAFMGVDSFPDSRIVTVAGTNGKGSTASMLASALTASGISCGLYTSPHILNFNERISVNGVNADEKSLCEAFSAVYDAVTETGIHLTFFEYTTLAAFWLFRKNGCRVLVLEVGLGGRLDAVNILDCDIAVIPSIGRDHCALLGNTEAEIAFEKAGIIKPSTRKVLLGYLSDEAFGTIVSEAAKRGLSDSAIWSLEKEIGVEYTDATHFNLRAPFAVNGVHVPALPLINAPLSLTAALLILQQLGETPDYDRLLEGIRTTRLHGRVEIISENPVVILDVAHNPPAMRYLASMLRQRGDGVRYAVIGMLKDKDIYSSLCELKGIFDRIFVCSLPGERGSTAEHVKDNLLRTGMAPEKVETFDTAYEAYVRAVSLLPEGAELVVCGSFVTAEELLRKLNANQEF